MTAVRLVSGATIRVLAVVEGEPDRIRSVGPSVSVLPQLQRRVARRSIVLTSDAGPGIASLMEIVAGWQHLEHTTPLRIACGRLMRSLDGQASTIGDQIVDLAVGLEAALAGGDKTEVGLRLRSRAAAVLETATDSAAAIYGDVKELYGLRSSIVHGDLVSGRVFERSLERVTGVARGQTEQQRAQLALDRWADLLRRAVLARVALATASPPWLLPGRSSQLDVDLLMLGNPLRAHWREHVDRFWSDLGLPEIMGPAPPMELSY